MRVTINVIWDVSVGVLTHNVLAPPAVPMPTPMISVEMICTQMWTLGFLVGQNKLTTKVMHKCVPIVLDGHDCGMMIPDITPPIMANLYYLIMWPFSSRKITFASSTVKMDGTPTGCAQIGLPPLPMMTCGDPVSAPTSLVLSNQLNTVTVGFSLFDLFMGILSIAISMIIDFVFEMVGGNGGKWKGAFTREGAGNVAKSIFGRQVVSRELIQEVAATAVTSTARILMGEAVKKMIPTSPNAVLKKVAGSLGGLLTSTLNGNPTFEIGIGGAGLEAKAGVTATPPGATPTDPDPSHFQWGTRAGGDTYDSRSGHQRWGQPL